MKVSMRNETTLVITPEDVAELMALHSLVNGKISIEIPKPFDSNVETLKIDVIPTERK